MRDMQFAGVDTVAAGPQARSQGIQPTTTAIVQSFSASATITATVTDLRLGLGLEPPRCHWLSIDNLQEALTASGPYRHQDPFSVALAVGDPAITVEFPLTSRSDRRLVSFPLFSVSQFDSAQILPCRSITCAQLDDATPSGVCRRQQSGTQSASTQSSLIRALSRCCIPPSLQAAGLIHCSTI